MAEFIFRHIPEYIDVIHSQGELQLCIKILSDSYIQSRRFFKVFQEKQVGLRQRLLKGEIACTPTEGACQFCDFGSICRYSGQLYKRNITSEELKKEREVHAEMEPGTTGSD